MARKTFRVGTYFESDESKIYLGNCLDILLLSFKENSIDAIVTDPPYGLKFMGKKWDHSVPSVEIWKECLRVLKPGGHMLVFCGTRTQHRMVVNIEDAGFEVRDVISWHYGSGFPKSLNVGKAIDREAGVERKVVGVNKSAIRKSKRDTVWTGDVWGDNGATITAPATEQAKKWDGWHTALKPATEFITVVRKPLSEKTVAKNVLKYGTGAINVDGCRVATNDDLSGGTFGGTFSGTRDENGSLCKAIGSGDKGRWPANLILSHAVGCKYEGEKFPDDKIEIWECVDGCPIKELNEQSENASRFFYCAKANKKEKTCSGRVENKHPTVKPIALMRYLVRLITPKGAIVLDLFMGSGSTLIAAKRNGCIGIGIDSDEESCSVARERLLIEADS